MKISEVIKLTMWSKRMSQAELSSRMGISQGSLSTMLRGNMKVGTLETILKFIGCELVIKDGEREYKIG